MQKVLGFFANFFNAIHCYLNISLIFHPSIPRDVSQLALWWDIAKEKIILVTSPASRVIAQFKELILSKKKICLRYIEI